MFSTLWRTNCKLFAMNMCCNSLQSRSLLFCFRTDSKCNIRLYIKRGNDFVRCIPSSALQQLQVRIKFSVSLFWNNNPMPFTTALVTGCTLLPSVSGRILDEIIFVKSVKHSVHHILNTLLYCFSLSANIVGTASAIVLCVLRAWLILRKMDDKLSANPQGSSSNNLSRAADIESISSNFRTGCSAILEK